MSKSYSCCIFMKHSALSRLGNRNLKPQTGAELVLCYRVFVESISNGSKVYILKRVPLIWGEKVRNRSNSEAQSLGQRSSRFTIKRSSVSQGEWRIEPFAEKRVNEGRFFFIFFNSKLKQVTKGTGWLAGEAEQRVSCLPLVSNKTLLILTHSPIPLIFPLLCPHHQLDKTETV